MVWNIIPFTADVLQILQCSALTIRDAFLFMTSEYNRKHYALVSEPSCVLRPNQLVLCVRPLVDVVTSKQSCVISGLRCTVVPILRWDEEKWAALWLESCTKPCVSLTSFLPLFYPLTTCITFLYWTWLSCRLCARFHSVGSLRVEWLYTYLSRVRRGLRLSVSVNTSPFH